MTVVVMLVLQNSCKKASFFRKISENCWDPCTRLAECDEAGVDIQVLSPIPILFNYWAKPEHALYSSQKINDYIADVVARYPERFVGLGTLPMQSPALAVTELRRCAEQLGLRGIEIGSHIDTANGHWNLNHPLVFPVLEAAAELGMAVFVHPWDMMGQKQMPQYWLPWLVGMPAESSLAICSLLFSGVFDKLPNLRVAFAHGGGAFPATLGRIAHAHQVRPDLCAIDTLLNPRDYCGRFWVDSLVHDPQMLSFVIDLFGANRVALGTDYPFPLGEFEPKIAGKWCPGRLIDTLPSIDSATKEQLLSGAALQWLGISI